MGVLQIFVSSNLGVVLEDERLEVFLLLFDPLLLRARGTRIDHTIEHVVKSEIEGKTVVMEAIIPVHLACRREQQHADTKENDHANQGECEVPVPQHSKHKYYQEYGHPCRVSPTKGEEALLSVDHFVAHHYLLSFASGYNYLLFFSNNILLFPGKVRSHTWDVI